VEPGLLTGLCDDYVKRCVLLQGLFTAQRSAYVAEDLAVSLADARDLIGALRDQIGDIDEWFAYSTERQRLVDFGLGGVVEYCEAESVPAAEVRNVVEKAVLRGIGDAILATDERCSPIRSEDRDALVEEFMTLDKRVVDHAASKVIDACNRRRPSQAIGEAGVIRREANKKIKHRPIRQLLTDAGGAAQALLPCFMMSPLTVSQFLPANLHFDVVIFDEASQVRPSDAVNAIYRGDQLIVAGDDKQLPPTSFFDLMTSDGEDEYDEDELDVFDSVLDLCKSSGGVTTLPLRWHYRSRHESLITYSNRAFYDGSLVTYPGALDEGGDLGLAFIHVPNGIYRRGEARDNPIEARRVAEQVLHHATDHPQRTLGVVAFSEAQATRISYELEAMRRERPDLDEFFSNDRLDGFFVKNLESVQGDERDIIIFSIGYGRDEHGKFTQNFGPINKPGGQRRLNVAATRARRRVEVVSSVTAADFPTDIANAGVFHLRGYLDYAERGQVALAPVETTGNADVESPFEEEVLRVIRDLDYIAIPQVGQAGYRIDIGIRDPARPGRYVLGVECDGAAYHSSKVARDRDRLRQTVLEGLGWTLHRIWGPAWYRNRAGETARLKEAIEAALQGRSPVRPSTVQSAVQEIELVDVDLDALPSWAVPYEVANLGYRYYGDPMHEVTASDALRQTIRTVVEVEGPISTALCQARVRSAWGNVRNSARTQARLDDIIKSMRRRNELLATAEGFLYLTDEQRLRVRSANADDPETIRKVADIASEELRLGLLRLISEAGVVEEDELTARVSQLFGWRRRGPDIAAALQRALKRLVRDKAVRRRPDGRLEPIEQ
jgi:hypothetical protein